MREKQPSPQKDMRSLPRQLLKPLKQSRINPLRPKLLNELVVIYRELFPVRGDGTLDVPRRDDLLVSVAR